VARVSRRNRNYALKAFMSDKKENDFDHEKHILSELNHPGIPSFIEAFEHDGVCYLVQEFINGYPLSYFIMKEKWFSEEEAKRILYQLLDILVYLHEPEGKRLPVIHRDLRLSNVFWCSDKVFLIDFGFACYFEGKPEHTAENRSKTDIKMSCCRPGEQTYALLRKEVSPRSDLFGAGVVGLDLFANWIEDEKLFQKPWQDILPASDSYKLFIEGLLNPEKQFASAGDALKAISQRGE